MRNAHDLVIDAIAINESRAAYTEAARMHSEARRPLPPVRQCSICGGVNVCLAVR